MKLTTPIAAGNTAEVYLRKGKIVKMYFREPVDAVEQEAGNQAYARSLGLQVPEVLELTEINGRPVLVMDYVVGETMLSLIEREPEAMEQHLAHSVEIQRTIHALAAPELRPMSDRLAESIRSVEAIDATRKRELLEMLDHVGEETQLCHGDFHVMNVMLGKDGPTVIDWMDATRGNRILDVCRTYVLYAGFDPDVADSYLEEYSRQSGVQAETVLAWEPVIAAARLSESVDEQERERLLELAR